MRDYLYAEFKHLRRCSSLKRSLHGRGIPGRYAWCIHQDIRNLYCLNELFINLKFERWLKITCT